jgi:formate C-acetyltransferase
LIAAKKHDLDLNAHQVDQKATDEVLQLRQELGQQIRALNDLKDMAKSYGFDISNPAGTAQEAVQWLYFGYLAAIKQQDGAAMSIGRIDTFLDIFIDKDLRAGLLSESAAQELIDNLIIKLRIVRFLRLEDFDAMYTGDPIWATVTLGGINDAAQPLVTKTSYRILHTLENLNPSPEPNMTVLWTDQLPESFKLYCTSLSILTSSIQYENDDIIRTKYDDDTAIACCVSPVPKRKGVQSIQLFGARMNGVKALLYGLNGGRDEVSGDQIFDPEVVEPYRGEILDYDQVYQKHFQPALEHLVQIYVEALNCIHFSHDRYFYESLEMALHDTNVKRTMGCGLAGLSHIVDSLSAIKYAKVRPVRDRSGLIVDYEVEGEFPTYGNDDQRADSIAEEVVKFVDQKLKDQYMYRQAEATLSLLTITANVEYGKNTGASPCGRRAGQPLAPGANPSNGSDKHGVIASMVSVGKIDFENCQDGISLTTTMTPQSLGSDHPSRKQNLTNILDKMFSGNSESRLYHSNINVLTSELLKDAYENPDDPRFNNLCIRISGYCVLWSKLTQEQRLDILSRTLHDTL